MATTACTNKHLLTCVRLSLSLLFSLMLTIAAQAQTATYRLHREASSTANLFQLKTANPDAAVLAIQSANLKNVANGEYVIKEFDTQAGVPNSSDVIPAGSPVTFTLWMKKTATAGTMVPRVKLRVNSAAGASILVVTGTTPLTTTLTKYTLSGTVPANVSMGTSDRFYLWVGVNLTATTTVNNRAELDIEGTVNGNYDSQITVPLPVTLGTLAGTITRTSDSAPINGALVEALQAGVVKASATTASNGAYTMSNVIAGTYDVRVSAIGYQTKIQSNVTVTGNTTTTFNQNLDSVAPGDISYIYDESGRLVSVVSPTETVTYVYDAVGNLLSLTRRNSNLPSIIEFAPNSGAIGVPVTIYGTGFSSTANLNTVKFNGVTATVTSATTTEIVTSVPAGATTGPITVNTPIGLATSSTPFTVIASAAPTITNFTPTIGTAGTAVTITGTNFETTLSNNRTAFNNTFAQLTSATTTTIGATVPAGGTSGRISVGTPNGKAVSSADFFIPPSPYVAADVAVTGRMTFGESKTVALPTAGKIGLILFDGNAGQRPSLKVNSSTIASCVVRINSPNGSTLASIIANTSGGFLDSPLLPVTGTYTILIDPDSTNVGSINFTLFNASDVTSTITPGGAPVTVTTTVMGQNATLTFNGTASQRVSLKLTGVNIGTSSCCGSKVSILNPNGSSLVAPTFVGTGGEFIDTKTLPVTGTYTILVDPQDMNTGSMTLTLYDVPADPTPGITPGGSAVTVTTTVPGQNAQPTFNGTAGQRISLRLTNVTIGTSVCCSVRVSIRNPDGTNLVAPTSFGTSGGFIDVKTLAATGQYTIFVDPQDSATGSITLTLIDVPADVTDTITPGGPPVTVTTTVAGQNALVTFNGTASQRISLKMTGVTIGTSVCCSVRVSIRNPDGTNLVAPTFFGTSGGFIDVKTLAATGQYTIFIDPQDTDTGSITLTLYDVPADPTSSITPGGSAVTVTTTVPGQNATSTFNGTAGQRISLRLTNVTIGTSVCCSVRVSIRNPDGTNLVAPTFVGTSGGFIDVKTLAATGQYTIFVDPQDTDTGSITLTLYDVPADVTGTVTIGGAAVNVTTTVPGQNGSLTFTGTSGQQVTVRVTSNTMGLVRVTLLKPDGTSLTSSFTSSGNFNLSTQTLPVNGTYTIKIDPDDFNTGSMNVNVTNP